ncbi:R3H domain-containing 4 [Brachionus plicatilis]|uniref:R3H domain-containing 4 n=1 Tax=Brachionus plicatilis TaxID=10195 RepID=A0A3M7RMM1_BRAPC|nr:R3H domain-containing 4 [Brachionus plicatilis]
MEVELPKKNIFKNVQTDEAGNNYIPNPMYDYSKRSQKKIRSKRQARRHESLCYLLSFFGHDYASLEEEDDMVQTTSILIENDSPFFKLISNEENLKHWLDFISKSGDKQDDFLENYESQIINHESNITKLDNNPFVSAHKRFLKIDKNLQPIYRKEYSLICLKKFESEIVPLFLCTPNSEYFISEIHCPFDRMVLYGLSQYLNIKSKSFEGSNGAKNVKLNCNNQNFRLQMPPILLSEYIQKRFFE